MARLKQDRTAKKWDPGYNFAIHSSPVKDEIGNYYRWHLQIIFSIDKPLRICNGIRYLYQCGVSRRDG
jgi:hypothetical protein